MSRSKTAVRPYNIDNESFFLDKDCLSRNSALALSSQPAYLRQASAALSMLNEVRMKL